MYSVPDQKLRADANYLAHQESSLVYWSCLKSGQIDKQAEPLLYVVDIGETFHSPAVAVPFNLDDPSEIEWLLVPASIEWHSIYQTDMETFIKQAKQMKRKANAAQKEREAKRSKHL